MSSRECRCRAAAGLDEEMMGGARAEKRVVMEMVATKGVAATVSEGVW